MNSNKRNQNQTSPTTSAATSKTAIVNVPNDQFLEFGEWLDSELKELEERYSSFETTVSNCEYFSR